MHDSGQMNLSKIIFLVHVDINSMITYGLTANAVTLLNGTKYMAYVEASIGLFQDRHSADISPAFSDAPSLISALTKDDKCSSTLNILSHRPLIACFPCLPCIRFGTSSSQ
jgi:hypothetical protein